MDSEFFNYMLDHASEGLKSQLKEKSRTRFSLISFLDKSKCDFASHFGNLLDLDLERLDGLSGESSIDISDDGFYRICKRKYARAIQNLLAPMIRQGESVGLERFVE